MHISHGFDYQYKIFIRMHVFHHFSVNQIQLAIHQVENCVSDDHCAVWHVIHELWTSWHVDWTLVGTVERSVCNIFFFLYTAKMNK